MRLEFLSLSPQWEEVRGVRWMEREALLELPGARFERLAGRLRLTLQLPEFAQEKCR